MENRQAMPGVVLQTGEGVNDVRKGACASHVSTMAGFLKVRAVPRAAQVSPPPVSEWSRWSAPPAARARAGRRRGGESLRREDRVAAGWLPPLARYYEPEGGRAATHALPAPRPAHHTHTHTHSPG